MNRYGYGLLIALALSGAALPAHAQEAPAPGSAAPSAEELRLARLMSEAREAMDAAKYGDAVRLYGDVLAQPAHRYSQEAQEYLGLALERSAEPDAAKTAYERYLQLYPEGEGAIRVRQRLAGLVTATWQPRPKLRTQERASQEGWMTFGSFSQSLRRDVVSVDGQADETQQWTLATNLDFNARDRHQDYDIQTRFNGGYLYDLDQATGDQAQLYAAYVDVNQRSAGLAARLGRQSVYSGGVLGRFDGLHLSYRPGPASTLGFLTGFPVERSRNITPDTGRYFYGAHIDYVPVEDWNLGAYLIEQRADGLLDRRALGGEARYTRPDRYFNTLLDYDVSYRALNIATVQGSRTWNDATTVTWVLDYRNSPPLATRNALQGQSADTLSDLRALYSEDQLRTLAQDRTTRSRLAMIGLAQRLTERYRVDGDFSVSSAGAAPASGGIEAIPATGNEYYLSARLTGTDFPRVGQVSTLGMRLGNTYTADSVTLFVDTRLPLRDAWRLYPRFRVDYRDYNDQDQTQWLVAPGLRLEYRWGDATSLEFDGSLEWSRREWWMGTQDTRAYYLNLGYRIDF